MASKEIVLAQQSAGELVPADVGVTTRVAGLGRGAGARARAQGVQLTGPGGLSTRADEQVLQTALQLEMGEHLGYERDDPSADGSGNSHDCTRTKAVRTDVGEVGIEVPRDRAATFGTVVVPKRARRLAHLSGAAPARRRWRRLSGRAAGGAEL